MMDEIVQVHIFHHRYVHVQFDLTDLDNQCDDNNGGCSQICNNTEGNYECSCRNGYVLDNDGQNCSGTSYIQSWIE